MINSDSQGILFLFPNVLGEENDPAFFPGNMIEKVPIIDGLIAENDKNGRKFLKPFSFSNGRSFRDIPIYRMNKHTTEADFQEILELLQKGWKLGLISDAGLPCIADPGSRLVLACRRLGIPVRAFSGPSSIFLALMLSGLPGQSFAFHGYFPKNQGLLEKKIARLVLRSKQENATQIFIEAPYRNEARLKQLIDLLPSETLLCVGWNISLPEEGVVTQRVHQWRKRKAPALHKIPAIFLFCSPAKDSSTKPQIQSYL